MRDRSNIEEKIADFSQLKILIVDSDVDHGKRLRNAIDQVAGVAVEVAAFNDDFLDRLAAESFDLLIIEILEPESRMARYAREIKQIKNDHCIIFFSSTPSYDHILFAVKEGGIDFFPKPISDADVARILELHRLRILKARNISHVDRYIVEKRVKLTLPTDVSILSYVSNRIADDIFQSGAVAPGRLYTLNLAIFEALTNALEHGNLGISYDEKSGLVGSGDYINYLMDKCKKDPYCNRKIHIDYHISRSVIKVSIEDEGRGFDAATYMEDVADQVSEEYHGRGLMLIYKIMDKVSFNTTGNRISFQLTRK